MDISFHDWLEKLDLYTVGDKDEEGKITPYRFVPKGNISAPKMSTYVICFGDIQNPVYIPFEPSKFPQETTQNYSIAVEIPEDNPESPFYRDLVSFDRRFFECCLPKAKDIVSTLEFFETDAQVAKAFNNQILKISQRRAEKKDKDKNLKKEEKDKKKKYNPTFNVKVNPRSVKIYSIIECDFETNKIKVRSEEVTPELMVELLKRSRCIMKGSFAGALFHEQMLRPLFYINQIFVFPKEDYSHASLPGVDIEEEERPAKKPKTCSEEMSWLEQKAS